MKINYDCIRDVLLFLEENLETNEFKHNNILMNQIISNLSEKYNENDIYYSVEKLIESKYITTSNKSLDSSGNIAFVKISDISWDGYDFLDTFRSAEVWDASKKSGNTVRAKSISALKDIGHSIVIAIATHPDIINPIVNALVNKK